ncbi:DUF2777 family protein [Bacillus sp. FJAT-42376]|uniref:DUF2777 family protein n=1 Tax=Bacillus sp. FJAT-42376 TaxID=2014076 RepID=UPI0013DE789C|nr:DUF2777 family protein [Bacillus sp. FJAT-42376]
MASSIRKKLLHTQERSCMTGNICCFEGEWLFFEEDADEGKLVDVMDLSDMHMLMDGIWYQAIWLSDGKIKTDSGEHSIADSHVFKIRRKLPFAFEQMLRSLDDDSLVRFTGELNQLGYSIYDCIYCYNHLLFTNKKLKTACTSFYQFDNEDSICGVQHHRMPTEDVLDRYEFTTSLGKRSILLLKK